MDALRFKIRGNHAFFKIPDVNAFYYFSYGQIHKVALLGIFGAILGYKGYGQKYEVFPEFYERLEKLSVSVSPESKNGYFSKKIQVFNNSVGYASKEQGGNLIIKEQWLEQPEWTIYVLLQDEESRKLAEAVINKKCEYTPYLGKNDHLADILDAKIVTAEETVGLGERIDSLFPIDKIVLDEEEAYNFRYEERLPIALKSSTNHYITERFAFTDGIVERAETEIYKIEGKNIIFY